MIIPNLLTLITALPDSTFRRAVTHLGSEAADVLAKEIEWHLSHVSKENSRYTDDVLGGCNNCRPLPLQDLERLIAEPKGPELAFVLVENLMEPWDSHLEGGTVQQAIECCAPLDNLLLNIFRQHIKHLGQQSRSWDPTSWRIKAKQFLWLAFNPDLNDDDEAYIAAEEYSLSAKSYQYLHNLAGRRYASIVTYKALGDRLPVELVDMVAECFYDKETLETLEKKADARRASLLEE